MAKIIFSGIGITDMRGKVGNEVFSRNRYGAFSRAYVIPANTITAPRTAHRLLYASLCSNWNSLPETDKSAWSAAALKFLRIPVIGRKYFSIGFNFFMQCNFNRSIAGLPVLSSPVSASSVSMLRSISVRSLSSSAFILDLIRANGSTSISSTVTVAIFASDSVSQGINYKVRGLRLVQAFTGSASLTGLDIFTAYSSIFGAPVSGQRVFIKAKEINNASGIASPFTWVSSDVS